jgi:membrane protein YdbS with pleckstrin-like domain
MAAAETHAERGTEIDLAEPVDPRTIAVWRCVTALAFTPAIALVSLAAIAATATRSPEAIAFWIAWPLLLALMAAFVWKYPPARYSHLRYRLDDVGITIRAGVFWRTWSALPRMRIQHTDVSQGPLQRRYGVATLKRYTAGSRFTRIELPGLEHGVAIALRDELQRRAGADAV